MGEVKQLLNINDSGVNLSAVQTETKRIHLNFSASRDGGIRAVVNCNPEDIEPILDKFEQIQLTMPKTAEVIQAETKQVIELGVSEHKLKFGFSIVGAVCLIVLIFRSCGS